MGDNQLISLPASPLAALPFVVCFVGDVFSLHCARCLVSPPCVVVSRTTCAAERHRSGSGYRKVPTNASLEEKRNCWDVGSAGPFVVVCERVFHH